jgi:hypothetical protein
MYKAINVEKLRKMFVDLIAKSMLNLYVYLDSHHEIDEGKFTMICKSLDKLDDILMVFMAE